MRTSAQVVVIGGGVVGASVLYHLTSVGLTDVMLVERSELTSGSTWHAAGGMHTLNGDPNVAALQQYTVGLYQEIERRSGHDCGIHLTGGLMLADTAERLDWLRMAHARGRYLGMDTELISVAEAKAIIPFMDERFFVGALYDPMEGHVDPSGVTWAYARAAQAAGAEVVQHTRVRAIRRRRRGEWELDCGEAGTITCEHVVNAAGLWAREVGRMCGIELPVLAMEHMYLLTESAPELESWNASGPGSGLHAMDFAGEVYMRREGTGLLLGTYEPDGVPWSPDTTPWDFGHQLLPPDIERIADNLEVAFRHFPIFSELGIKQVINGPFTFAPDGNPLIGPIRGQPGHWVACGVMAGLSQGGGVGLALANWIATGDPGFDVWGMDVARFGDFATPAYTNQKVRENYGRRFRIAYPNEELPAARPLRTSPIHDRLDAANAVWGAAYGLEHALWFQRGGLERVETPTLRRSNAWACVAGESRAVRDGVGMIETTGFAKFAFTGRGARAFLDGLLANRIPAVGRIALTPMLSPHGLLAGDLTVAVLPATAADVAEDAEATERFMVFGTGAAERYYERWFDMHLPGDGSVRYRSFGPELCGLSIAGPAAREVLAEVAGCDVSPDALRFLDVRRTTVGAVPVVLGRLTFTGDLGYELWVEPTCQRRLFDVLTAAGTRHGLRLFGARALDSLRLEKSFGAWATEYRPIYDPYEAGLGMFVKIDKGPFVGRDAARRRRDKAPRRLVTFTIDADDTDVTGDEPIWHDDEVVGWVTSGGYAHASQASVALGYVPTALADADDGFAIEVVGQRRAAIRQDTCLLDPSGSRMRA